MEACLSGVIYLHNSHSGIFHHNEDSLRFVRGRFITPYRFISATDFILVLFDLLHWPLSLQHIKP